MGHADVFTVKLLLKDTTERIVDIPYVTDIILGKKTSEVRIPFYKGPNGVHLIGVLVYMISPRI